MVIMKSIKRTILALLVLTMVKATVCLARADQEVVIEEDVKISPKCAAVLIAAGTTVGVGTAYVLTPLALCSAGFCSTGVAGGSFAAWWQSTLPLVASGSLFAQLQALAMGGTGIQTITIAAGAVGGMAGATYLREFCTFVEDAEPDSVVGKAIDASVVTVTSAIRTKDYLTKQCATSETCKATVDATAGIANAAGEYASTLFGSIMAGLKEGFAGEEEKR